MEKLTELADERLQPVLQPSSVSLIQDLPVQAQAVYHAWRAGVDIRTMYKKNRFYFYRRLLKKVGVDISYACSELSSPVQVRELFVQPASMPSFYQLPSKIAA